MTMGNLNKKVRKPSQSIKGRKLDDNYPKKYSIVKWQEMKSKMAKFKTCILNLKSQMKVSNTGEIY